jgi:UDP-N-acetylglucosamine--N-acetylmuramyl-(pentapeptide) pyrophosphoryl-undecaprenol N-acetylglucosamine transferase
MIMAGGTGGHVYPALAVAEYLRGKGVTLYWLGTRHGLEASLVPARNLPLLTIGVRGLRGRGAGAWLLAPFRLTVALIQSLLVIARCRPGAVLGMGGFASGPGGLAAWLLRIPLLVHEQNAIAGLTNRLLAPLATLVMEGFPGTFPPERKARATGNPVREEIARIAEPETRLAGREPGVVRLLILGGSQGARALNELVPAALRELDGSFDLEVLHQTGAAHAASAAQHYAGLKVRRLTLAPFIEDMAAAYSWADLVLCRAGALTIAELCAAGLASVLVPFPYAVDDHQTANARHLRDAGCALLLSEAELNPRMLADVLAGLCTDRARLLDMARRCRRLGRPGAARDVGELCLEAAGA